MEKLNKFYFTFGAEDHAYKGGWSEVYAADIEHATKIFNLHHKTCDDIIQCAGVYQAENFEATKMYENGNFGAFCQEVLRPYENRGNYCECWKCEFSTKCKYADKYTRFPKDVKGGLGLCPIIL